MSDKSESESSRKKSKSRSRSRQREREKTNKLFVTNLDGNARQTQLEQDLRKQFSKYGNVDHVVVKKSRNSQYSFAFVQFEKGEDGNEAVKNLDQTQIGGKKIRVEFQNDSRRRKDRNQGCYICHKFGHFARQCRQKRDYSDRYRDDRKKRSRSRHDKKRRSRSRSHKSKKQKKKRSRSRSNDSRRKNDKHKRSRSRNRSNSSRS